MSEIRNLSKSYGENKVFDDLSLTFETGKVTAILGNSGIGKTTLLNAIAGLIDFDGQIDISEKGISYVFQSPRLIEHLTARENVEYVLGGVYKDKIERRKVVDRFLELAHAKTFAGKFPNELSGGELQRVQLARAFSYPSELLLMDEPFSSLDIALKTQLIALYVDLLEKSPRTVLMVTHDPYEALLFADDIIVLKKGGTKKWHVALSKKLRNTNSAELSEIRQSLYDALQSQDD